MKDLREVVLRKREGFQAGVAVVLGLLIFGTLLLTGIYAYSKIASAVPTTSFSAAENTTFDNVKANMLSGFDLSSIGLITLAIGAVIVGLVALVRYAGGM